MKIEYVDFFTYTFLNYIKITNKIIKFIYFNVTDININIIIDLKYIFN